MQQLKLAFCQKIHKIIGITKLSKLEVLELYKCRHLSKLELKDLVSLQDLYIALCQDLSILKFHNLPNLRKIKLEVCPEIRKISGLNKLPNLGKMDLVNNKNLKELKLKNLHQNKRLSLTMDKRLLDPPKK